MPRVFAALIMGLFFTAIWATTPTDLEPKPTVRAAKATCPTPTSLGIIIIDESVCGFSWSGTAPNYEVHYRRIENGTEGSPQGTAYTNALTHTFSGMAPGTYRLYVRSLCDGGSSEFIGAEDVMDM